MKKNLVVIMLIALFSITAQAQSPSVTETAGWLETAMAKWSPVSGAESYNVYVSGNGLSNVQVDDQLIRSYGSYYRVDVPGLAAGSYTLKIAAVISGSERAATTTGSISVKANDRTGFAFNGGRVPGAYKADGTPKSGAVILYITENTKNVISLDVTGASSNPCVGLQTILDGIKKGKDTRPFIIRLVGEITDLSYMLNGDIVVENNNNASSYITVEGIGDDAVANGWGIRIKNASNVEVRNIGTINCDSGEGDNVGLQQGNDYIWVHNCDFFYGDAGGDADQAKGDGALDCKKSTYITFSYNHFWDSGKCNLLGLSEGSTTGYYITYHHNWYDHSDSRHPRVRYYSAHVYNNYYDGNAKYGVGSTLGSSVFVEGNYFRNCKYPMLTSMQGTDINEGDGTFSSEDGGTIKAFNNYMTGQKRYVAYGSSYPVEFDAIEVSSKSETISSSIKSKKGSNSYNNFDNSSAMYSYTAESPESAKATVMKYAGRMDNGDFTWTFDNSVDDASYAVNTALKAKLVNYSTSLVSVQGENNTVDPVDPVDPIDPDPTDPTDPTDPITGDVVHNFTASGSSSSVFTITGNLSTSKGTVTYNGLTLTQCLKMESSTSVAFTTSEEATLELVLNSDFSGAIKIDGTSYTASAGIVTIDIAAGSHTITKGDSANLFYIAIAYTGTVDPVEPATLTKQGVGSSSQTIDLGDAITTFNYAWANATSATASGLPNGLSVTIDNTAQTITISGAPTETGTFAFTVVTTGATENATTSGTITVNEVEVILPAELVKQGVGSSNQTVDLGIAIVDFNYAWANATSASASGLPNGVTATVDNSAQTITISGTPTEVGTFSFTVVTTGASDNASTSGTITINAVENVITSTIQEGETGFCSVDGTIDSNNAGFSGAGFANTTNELGAGINWYLFADGGSYTLTWNYANGGSTDRTANLIINNETVASIAFGATGSWTTWGTATATVVLDYGVYDIRLEATTASGLGNVDYLEISGSAHSIVECGTVIEDEEVIVEPSTEYIHNFTEAGTSSDFFSISGNLSTSKGTVSYSGLTLTQCLKLESSTSISFTTTEATIITLVLNDTFTGTVKIDGTSYSASAGIITASISAGSHTLTKGDSANLYYISVASDTTKSATLDSEDEQDDVVVLTLAPNPVQDQLMISTNDEVNAVQVYNLSGTMVIDQKGNDTTIDMSRLDAGSYIVVVSTSKSLFKQIIIKQ